MHLFNEKILPFRTKLRNDIETGLARPSTKNILDVSPQQTLRSYKEYKMKKASGQRKGSQDRKKEKKARITKPVFPKKCIPSTKKTNNKSSQFVLLYRGKEAPSLKEAVKKIIMLLGSYEKALEKFECINRSIFIFENLEFHDDKSILYESQYSTLYETGNLLSEIDIPNLKAFLKSHVFKFPQTIAWFKNGLEYYVLNQAF